MESEHGPSNWGRYADQFGRDGKRRVRLEDRVARWMIIIGGTLLAMIVEALIIVVVADWYDVLKH